MVLKMFLKSKYLLILYIFTLVLCGIFLTLTNEYSQRISLIKKSLLCKDCNILLISLDTCSAVHMPCYGYNRNTTPNLCEIGKKGIFFENAYTQANWTVPSHTSIFTGMFPFVHKMNGTTEHIDQSLPFLPEILQQNGYETHFYVEKDEYNFPTQQIYNRGIAQRHEKYSIFDVFSKLEEQTDNNTDDKKKKFFFFHSPACHSPYVIGEEPLRYTKNIIPSLPVTWDEFNNSFTQPFYQYLLDRIPIGLDSGEFLVAPQQVQTFLKNLRNAPNLVAAQRIYKDGLNQGLGGEELIIESYNELFNYWNKIDWNNPEHIEFIKGLYDQQMHSIDERILAPLLTKFTSSQLLQNTIVVITADHGEEFIETRKMGHMTLNEGVTKVPFILVIPGIPQTSIKEYVQSVDITPTLLELVGVKHAYTFNGKSLLPLITGGSLGKRLIIAEGNNSQKNIATVRDGDWKLFIFENEDKTILPYELYNTKADPEERNNILGQNMKRASDIVKRYKALKK